MKSELLIMFTLLLFSAGVAANLQVPVKAVDCSETALTTHTQYYLSCKSCPDLYLDLKEDNIDAYLQLWQPNTSYAQRFFLIQDNDNQYRIKKAGQELSIHVIPEQRNTDNSLRIGGDIAGNTGSWQIKNAAEDGYYFLISAYNGKALSANHEIDYKDMIKTQKFTGNADQMWQLIPVR